MCILKHEDVFIQIVKSQGITCTCVLPDQEKEDSENKQQTKNKNIRVLGHLCPPSAIPSGWE